MRECCISGFKHEGETKGEIKQVGGVKAYIATPSKPNGNGILYMPDAFGVELPNNCLLADEYANAGYTTVIPDYFHGDPVPADALNSDAKEKFDLYAWVAKHPIDRVDPVLEATIKYMKEELGVKKLAAVGYCFGGRHVIRYLGSGKIDAGFAAHPSLVEDAEVEAVKGPLSLACAETDFVFGPERRQAAEAILAKGKAPYESRVFGATDHGFAVRCDLEDPRQKYAKETAFTQATLWFDEWLKV